MTSQLLGRTHHKDVESLTASGLPIHEMLSQIRLELRKSVGEAHALLFAEPNANPETGHIQWYASTEGTPQRLNELAGAERQAAEARLAQLTREILAHAARLRESSNPQDQQIAKTLGDALEIPREADIFMIGSQPVIAAWGHVQRGREAERQILRTLAERVRHPESPRPPLPAVGPSPDASQVPRGAVLASVPAVAVRERSWLGPFLWLVLVLLLLAIAYLLLRNCALGIAGSALVDYCPAPQAEEDLLRRQMLERRLAELQRQLEEARNRCVAPPGGPPGRRTETTPDTKPETKPPPPQERVERGGGRIGNVNVVLTWQGDDDLDLGVICPGGEAIDFNHRQACNGVLDVDQNVRDGEISRNPVENIVWGENAPPGRYKVLVGRAKDRPPLSPSTPFTVQLLINRQVVRTESGQAESGKWKDVFTFDLPPPGGAPPSGAPPSQGPRKP